MHDVTETYVEKANRPLGIATDFSEKNILTFVLLPFEHRWHASQQVKVWH